MEEILYYFILFLVLYMAPLVMVGISSRTRGNAKTAWILATIFLSWLAVVTYFATVPKASDKKDSK